MKLEVLLADIKYKLIQGNLNQEVSQIDYDSREVKENSLFVCIQGAMVDGHKFIDQVIEKGAKTIVVNKEVEYKEGITYIQVDDSRLTLALLSCAFFDHPSRKINVIGVTGTKGKTTTTYMLKSILENAGKKVGIIGTIGSMINGQFEKTKNTTPESFELQRLMNKMVNEGCEYCLMEVSSQGLMLNRVAGIEFDYGIFTNLSPDHIGPNEHRSFDHYKDCKKMLFHMCKVGIFNKDDAHYEDMIKDVTCEIYTYSLKDGDLTATNIELYNDLGHMGVKFDASGLLEGRFHLDMPGYFNVYNAMVAMMLAHFYHIDHAFIHATLPHVRVSGRAELFHVSPLYTVIIDYAHNALSVKSILETIQTYNPSRIVCVYGSIGDRAKGRRKEMGEIIAKMSQFSIVTEDNRGFEDIRSINKEIIEGIQKYNGEYIEIDDRKEAIIYALDHAKQGDVILLLGKGHEDYQLVKDQKVYFSEKDVLAQYKQLLQVK